MSSSPNYDVKIKRLEATQRVVEQALAEKVFTAASLAVLHPLLPEPHVAAWGRTPQEATTPETYFDLASVTKVFVATLFARLVDRGWVSYDTRLAQYVRDADPGILARHLLSHSAGLVAYEEYFKEIPINAPLAERRVWLRDRLAKLRPEVEPGSRVLYSDPSFLLLGFMIEAVTGRSLDEALREFVLNPMGISSIQYAHPKGPAASTEECPWRKRVMNGEVHDENAWSIGGVAGHAGLFGRARDVLDFAQRLLAGFLSPQTTQKMWSPCPPDQSRTLGWDIASPTGSSLGGARESLFGGFAVGHLGYTGTSVWLSPKEKTAVVLLTNRVYPTRKNEAIKLWRPRIHEAVSLDLGKT